AEGQCAPLTCTSRGPLPLFAFTPIDALFGGAELRVDVAIPETPFELSGNASWVRARDRQTGDFVPFVPTDRYRLLWRYRWADTKATSGGYLELGATLVDTQRRFDLEMDFAAPPPLYALADAGVGVEFPLEQQRLRLSLRGTNLLNRRYRDYNSLLRYFADEPGRGVQLRFSVEFAAKVAR